MEKDFLKEIEYLGLIARLKRLSDAMLYSIRDMYKFKGLDIEPNWHLVFLALKKHKTMTMTEIARSFRFSQPAVVKIITKMKDRGYVDVVEDANDSRKRQIKLSKKSLDELPFFENIWKAGGASIKEMLEVNKEFMGQLENLEQQLEEQNFKDRVMKRLK